MDADIVLIQLGSDKEVAEVIKCAKDSPSFPFIALERWMEVIGSSLILSG